MKKPNKYAEMSLTDLIKKEWSARHLGKYFGCPSCGGWWYCHCQGCKLEKAILEKQKETAANE